MKKFLVLLLCALAVFAIVSCKNDPKVETFKVIFDSQGGSAVAAATVEKDAKVTKPENPVLLGSDFEGWYTEATCENAYDFDTPVTKDITLYAKWSPAGPFTVTFDSVDGSAVPAATVAKGSKVAKPEDPTRGSLIFKGWFTDDKYTAEYDFEAAVTKSFTLYAKWERPTSQTYKFTSTKADTRFQFKWDAVESSGGKVFTLKYKSDKALATFTIRDPSAGKYSDGAALSEYTVVGEDGWTTFTYTIPEGTHAGIGLALFESEAAAIGDVLFVKDIYIGDVQLTLAQANSWAGNESTITAAGFKLTATKGTDGVDDHKYDQDKFTLYWNPNVKVNPGDVFSVTFKPVRTDEMTAGRPFTYSIRDAKKWFSEKGKGDADYPQFWSTFDESDPDGWITATYVFPDSSAATKETITYPATFRVDFRDTKIASPSEGRTADVLYVKNMTLTSGETTIDLILDEARTKDAYADPTIEVF